METFKSAWRISVPYFHVRTLLTCVGRQIFYNTIITYENWNTVCFLAKFRNKITTILTTSTLEGGEGGGGNVFRFGGPWIKIGKLIYIVYVHSASHKFWDRVSKTTKKNSKKFETNFFIQNRCH